MFCLNRTNLQFKTLTVYPKLLTVETKKTIFPQKVIERSDELCGNVTLCGIVHTYHSMYGF